MDTDKPNPAWTTPEEGEVVGGFMFRNPDGSFKTGKYVYRGGEVVEESDETHARKQRKARRAKG